MGLSTPPEQPRVPEDQNNSAACNQSISGSNAQENLRQQPAIDFVWPISYQYNNSGQIRAIERIESSSFKNPWPLSELESCLRDRNNFCLVAKIGDNLVGYCIYELLEDSRRIISIAVDPAYRRQNIGRQLVERVVAHASVKNRYRICALVLNDNIEALNFFGQLGFKVATGNDQFPLAREMCFTKREDQLINPSSLLTSPEPPIIRCIQQEPFLPRVEIEAVMELERTAGGSWEPEDFLRELRNTTTTGNVFRLNRQLVAFSNHEYRDTGHPGPSNQRRPMISKLSVHPQLLDTDVVQVIMQLLIESGPFRDRTAWVKLDLRDWKLINKLIEIGFEYVGMTNNDVILKLIHPRPPAFYPKSPVT